MKIGIYGGTFNPIHLGHISLAKQLQRQFSLDRVLLIPTGEPPHKQAKVLAPATDRIALCRLATAEYPEFAVCDLELQRGGKSYTVDTLRELRNRFPNDRLFLILGSDMLFSFTSWKEYRTILKETVLLAGARKWREYDALQEKAKELCAEGGKVLVSRISVVPISSTVVRMRMAQGADCRDFLPPSVETYIKEHALYSDRKQMVWEIQAIAAQMLKPERLRHTQCVVKEALRLAHRFHADPEQAELAAWLHDILKNQTKQSLLQMMDEYGIILSELERRSPALWHAIVAPDYCRCQLGIVDSQVLTAIRYHTTGRAGMSLLEQILYLADAISEDRDYPGVELLRNLAEQSLESAILTSLTSLLSHLLSQGLLLHPDTVAAYQELTLTHMEDVL